ncbi:MAG TPA: hypothetical protein VFN57_15095 [Thermomicrobiaceae bacterium]|nr:hypothetical protein [Thermomicrobiaceae bacterium]
MSDVQPEPRALTLSGSRSGEPRTVKGFAASYLRLCRGQARPLTSMLVPQAGEWLLRADGDLELELAGDPPRALAPGEVVVPRLDRVVQLLRAEAEALVVDYHSGDYACVAFDAEGRSLANVVSRNPEEAALRALLFVQSEKAENVPTA